MHAQVRTPNVASCNIHPRSRAIRAARRNRARIERDAFDESRAGSIRDRASITHRADRAGREG